MKLFKSVTIAMFLLLALVPPALALGMAGHQEPLPTPTVPDVVVIFGALVGWPAFLLYLTSLLKKIGWVSDGLTPTFVFYANVVAFGLTSILVFTGKIDLLNSIDQSLGTVALILSNLLILLGGLFPASLAVNKFFYLHTRGYPLVGYTHTKAIGKVKKK